MFEIGRLSTHICTLLCILIVVPWLAILFGPLSHLLVTSPLSALRGVLLLFLMLPWFDGMPYVFIICSYVLIKCSSWVPMHFGEMDHLPYWHSSFHSYFGCILPCLIHQLFNIWCFMPSISSSLVFCLLCASWFE